MSAQVIAHSISEAGAEIITFQLSYWRAIHGELMTHRDFSRSAMSSRAVPIERMLRQCRDAPFIPKYIGKNQSGMQAPEQLSIVEHAECVNIWRQAAAAAAGFAQMMSDLGVAKQIGNRVLEPFQIMHTVVTATNLDNFWELRRHPDAEPHFHDLADSMWEARERSTPVTRFGPGHDAYAWHLPYITLSERDEFSVDILQRASTARCARVSYNNHDGTAADIAKDQALFDRLAAGRPFHASPLEHQAMASFDAELKSRNFRGWHQFRAVYEQEYFHAQ